MVSVPKSSSDHDISVLCSLFYRVSVLCPLVSTMQDLGKILAVLHSREKIRIDGESNFIAALKTATVSSVQPCQVRGPL